MCRAPAKAADRHDRPADVAPEPEPGAGGNDAEPPAKDAPPGEAEPGVVDELEGLLED